MTFTFSKHNFHCGVIDDEGLEGIVDATPHELTYAILRASCNKQRNAEAFLMKNISREEYDKMQSFIDKKQWKKARNCLKTLNGLLIIVNDDLADAVRSISRPETMRARIGGKK